MLARRAFIARMALLPVAVPIIGEGWQEAGLPPSRIIEKQEFDPQFDAGPHKPVSAKRYATYLFKRLARELRGIDSYAVGQPNARLGSAYGSSMFTHQIFAFLPSIPTIGSQLGLDRVMLNDVARLMAGRIREHELNRFGHMPLEAFLLHREAVASSRLALRFLTIWNIEEDALVGRFDVLGAKA